MLDLPAPTYEEYLDVQEAAGQSLLLWVYSDIDSVIAFWQCAQKLERIYQTRRLRQGYNIHGESVDYYSIWLRWVQEETPQLIADTGFTIAHVSMSRKSLRDYKQQEK